VSQLKPGDVLTGLEVGPVAHGGHFVARHEGQVIFVRHALTGESVDVRITEVNRRFARASVIAVGRASPHRVEPPCPVAGRCGGCDFQHVRADHARELKRQVVAEQLAHLAGYAFTAEVAEVQPAPLHWRGRMRYRFDEQGRPGLLAHRSGELVPLPEGGCRIASPQIASPQPTDAAPGEELIGIVAGDGLFLRPGQTAEVIEQVGGLRYRVAGDGFWQPHVAAAQTLTSAVLDALAPVQDEVAFDLFCGVGLFAGALAAAGCQVWGIEGSARAVELARQNVASGRFFAGDVARRLHRLPRRADLVVLDPPRTGAGAQVLNLLVSRRPRRIAYVACDPAALGRDLRTLGELGYHPTAVSAYDLFPLTHHVECLAILEPDE
jgi:SAM-dependent methyltransferases related to tRNA (uracil-5-)-methyltransferase